MEKTLQNKKLISEQKKILALLNYLQKNGPQSRIDLSKKLSLTKAMITNLINEMIKTGILVEKGEKIESNGSHSRGRRRILLDINENYKLVFGIVVEKDVIHVGLTNLKGQVLDKSKKHFKDISYRELLELIVLNISLIMKNNCITNDNVLGIGVCISVGGGELIEGAKKTDKITRIKKDLAHALPIKIATNTTIGGGLMAQRIFSEENSKSVLLLRLGENAESSVMINGEIYRGFNAKAGGFLSILDSFKGESAADEDYIKQVARAIVLCNNVLDVERIYCFGTRFEDLQFLEAVQAEIIQQGHKDLELTPSLITEDSVFLSPCAQAVDSFYYSN